MSVIWLTGASGLLGKALQKKHLPHLLLATGHEVDITNHDAVRSFIHQNKVTTAINCAAFTQVDQAEKEPFKAFFTNAIGPYIMAKELASIGGKLIHFSTDYVFDGQKKITYNEQDAPHPLSVYGKSKLSSEKNITAVLTNTLILRTAWLYGEGSGFVHTMLNLLAQEKPVSVIANRFGSPTFADNLATVVVSCLNQNIKGLYHATDGGIASWYEMACLIREEALKLGLLTKAAPLIAIKGEDYPSLASRPAFSALDSSTLYSGLKLRQQTWQEAIKYYLKSLL